MAVKSYFVLPDRDPVRNTGHSIPARYPANTGQDGSANGKRLVQRGCCKDGGAIQTVT